MTNLKQCQFIYIDSKGKTYNDYSVSKANKKIDLKLYSFKGDFLEIIFKSIDLIQYYSIIWKYNKLKTNEEINLLEFIKHLILSGIHFKLKFINPKKGINYIIKSYIIYSQIKKQVEEQTRIFSSFNKNTNGNMFFTLY